MLVPAEKQAYTALYFAKTAKVDHAQTWPISSKMRIAWMKMKCKDLMRRLYGKDEPLPGVKHDFFLYYSEFSNICSTVNWRNLLFFYSLYLSDSFFLLNGYVALFLANS